MLNIVDNNKYILEIETEACILISVYERDSVGLESALIKIETFILMGKEFFAQILCSNSKEVVWSSSYAKSSGLGPKDI